jgi:hypothetical protein
MPVHRGAYTPTEQFTTEPRSASQLPALARHYGAACQRDGYFSGAANALFARIAALVQREEADALQTIADRDLYHEWADKLAEAIAERTGVDIGEHSNVNNPWRVAYESAAALVQQPVQARDSMGRTWWQHLCGAAWPMLTAPDVHEHCLRCETEGPWRQMLVADAAPDGDRAPEELAVEDLRAYGAMAAGWRKPVEQPDGDPAPETEAALIEEFGPQFGPFLARERGVQSGDRAPEAGRVSTLREQRMQELAAAEITLREVMQELDVGRPEDVLSVIRMRDGDAERARAYAGQVQVEAAQKINEARAETAAEVERYQRLLKSQASNFAAVSARSGMTVLRLDKIPDGTAALVGKVTGHRYVPGRQGSWVDEATGQTMPYVRVMEREGEVTAVLAPKPKPRTWARVSEDLEPQDLPRVVYVDCHGQWMLQDGRRYVSVGDLYQDSRTLTELRILGQVTELTDQSGAEDG